MTTYNNCEYCNKEIHSEAENYAGAFEDSCCKSCSDAADTAVDKSYL